MLEIDETELTEFFGVLPQDEDAEEKEFFGTTTFEVTQNGVCLSVTFSSHHNDMSFRLTPEAGLEPVLEATVKGITKVRVQREPARLSVLGRAEGSTGSDPQLTEKVAITLDPLRVRVSD